MHSGMTGFCAAAGVGLRRVRDDFVFLLKPTGSAAAVQTSATVTRL
ncbi:MAG: hypothetical protein WAL56_23910 [Candidatus Sulfotelmatobacter sp.]